MFKKIAATTVLVAGLSSAALVSATAPAAALSDGAAAAIGLGAFAAGAMAAGGAGGYYDHHVDYPDCYTVRRPIYNRWGDVIGFHAAHGCD